MSRLRTPEVEVIHFNEADVIVASGVLTLGNFGNGITGDATGTYKNYTYDSSKGYQFLIDINRDLGHSEENTLNLNKGGDLGALFGKEIENDLDYLDRYNGTYKWQNGQFVKTPGTNQ